MKQAGQVVVQGAKRRVFVGCMTILIGVPVMACCLFSMWTYVLPQVEQLTANRQTDTPVLLLVAAVLLIAGLILMPAVAMGLIILRRARMLNSVFTPLGLQGEMYMMVGRHYWGKIDGVEVDIYIYRGPTMEIRLSSQSRTRVQIMSQASIPAKVSGVLQKAPLALADPAFAKYAIYAEDEAWAQKLFTNGELPSVLHSLMVAHSEWPVFRHVEIQPNEVMLYLHRSTKLYVNRGQFTAVSIWINDLMHLSALIEEQPTPSISTQPLKGFSRLERQRKSKRLLYMVLAILIGLPAVLIGIGILSYLLIS